MAKDNGGIIGVLNTPSTTSAKGVWALQDQYQAKRNGTWPFVYSINFLIVAGGGAGAGNLGGGGGAGGLLTGTTSLSSGTVYTITVGAGGTADSSIGIQIGSEGSSPQKFLTGIYFNPSEIKNYGIFIDANSASTNTALVAKHSVNTTALQIKSEGTPVSANAWLIYTDGSNANKFGIKQDGKLVFTTGITVSTTGGAGAAQVLPSNPTGYLQVEISGFTKLIPYYEP